MQNYGGNVSEEGRNNALSFQQDTLSNQKNYVVIYLKYKCNLFWYCIFNTHRYVRSTVCTTACKH
jgi:hypothetical protein